MIKSQSSLNVEGKTGTYRPAEEVQLRVGRAERRVVFMKVTVGKKGEKRREIECSKMARK